MATKKTSAAAPATEDIIEPGRVKRLIVKNFRGIGKTPVIVDLDSIVVLVGPNNAGKSSILRAYEAIMQDGSKDGHLTEHDFPDGKIDPENLPTIELHTAVTKQPPASKWVTNEDGEPIVKERWVWKAPGEGKRQGWNTELAGGAGWDENKVPWGAANVANTRRPQPHWVKAFDTPEDQADKINKLITTMITDKAKSIPVKDAPLKADGVTPMTKFEVLQNALKEFQDEAFELTKADVEKIETQITKMVADVFAEHVIKFSLFPPADNAIKLFSAGCDFSVGHKDGWKGPLQNQGSGARRTILWAVLRILSEQNPKASERPRVLLIDEPELCLHPSAVREACRVLYDLAEKAGWQVIVTTHSPVFIDLTRDNTTVVRVERIGTGDVVGTTLYRPDKTKLGEDDRKNLQLLNLYDPYVAEFFFGGRVIIVEGDTEYAAFKYVISQVRDGNVKDVTSDKFADVHIVRARGKATIVSLCKILNHFGKPYSVLHDTDTPMVVTKEGKERKNPAWAHNQSILNVVNESPVKDKIRVLASVKNFEKAFLGTEVDKDKPYNAITELGSDPVKLGTVCGVLLALLDTGATLPTGAMLADKVKEEDFKEAA